MSDNPTTPPEGTTPEPEGSGQPDPYNDPTAPTWSAPTPPPPPPAYEPPPPPPAQPPAAPPPPPVYEPPPAYTAGGAPEAQPPYPTQEQYQQQYPQAQPVYGQVPAGYPAGPSPYAVPEKRNNTSALVLLIVSILTVVFCCNPISIASAVLGGVGLSRQSTDPEESRKFARWGWVVWVAGMAIGVVVLAILAITGTFTSSSSSSSGI